VGLQNIWGQRLARRKYCRLAHAFEQGGRNDGFELPFYEWLETMPALKTIVANLDRAQQGLLARRRRGFLQNQWKARPGQRTVVSSRIG